MRPDIQQFWIRDEFDPAIAYDAIVVGSGAAGGVAADALCRGGLSVLVLEAGLLPGEDRRPLTAALASTLGFLTRNGADRLPPLAVRTGEKAARVAGRLRQPVQSKCFAWTLAPDALIDDIDCPYTTDPGDPFVWIRSRQPGGRMMVPGHGRQYYRMLEDDGHAALWPFAKGTLAPWYGEVERQLKLRGGQESASVLPESELSEVLVPDAPEQAIIAALKARWPDAEPILGHHAEPAAWLDLAAGHGNMRARAGAVARRVLYGSAGMVEGVECFDRTLGRVVRFQAPIVFLCASAIETTRILLNSRRPDAPAAVGLHSPALGAYLMDHAVVSATGYSRKVPGRAMAQADAGRCIYLPPISAESGQYGVQIHLHPRSDDEVRIDIVSFAEMAPEARNTVSLNPSKMDAYGMPAAHISFRYSDAQAETAREQIALIGQIAADLGVEHLICSKELAVAGTGIHECGTARMGNDPATSVVDANNECWDVQGLYLTDAACFPGLDATNPTLTIMALSARAAAHAVEARRAGAVGHGPVRLQSAGQ